MDLAVGDKPVRDQIGSAAAHSWGSWKCPCNGCTKARKNERLYVVSEAEKFLEEFKNNKQIDIFSFQKKDVENILKDLVLRLQS